MQAERKRPDAGFVVPSVERAQMRAVCQDDGEVDPAPSPTHLLQRDLATRLAPTTAPQLFERIWSSRVRFTFIMAISVGLWAILLGAIALIL